jgi:hypothetical protein
MNLEDVCLLRSNALTRLLAGALAIDPVIVLPMLDRLKPEALTDLQARRYITAMQGRLQELQAADIDRQIAIGIETARDSGLMMDYMRWITLVNDLRQDATAAIRDLQALAITLNTLAGLRDWIRTCEEISEWR